jgi:dTDP-4-dehydrorhamnose reductase
MNTEVSAERIWITGAGGLIGSHLCAAAALWAPHSQLFACTRQQLDLSDFAAVRRAFREQRPGLVIHCAALSRSTVCQEQPALARRLNVELTAHLAELAAEIPLVLLSTDLVFDGRKGSYVESDAPNPLGVYAETKLAAEQLILANPRHTVIRTSLTGGRSPAGDRGFNEVLRQAWRAGRAVTLFTDEFRTPIPAPVTARAMWALLAQDTAGLFHLAGAERLSRWQMGQLVAARCPELSPRIEAASLQSYQGAPRPPDTSLDCRKIQRFLSFPLPGLAQWLTENPDEPF